MPTLMLRALSAELVEKIRAYARGRGLALPAASADLITAGLERRAGQSAGGVRAGANMTPEQRTDRARRAVMARWERQRLTVTHKPTAEN